MRDYFRLPWSREFGKHNKLFSQCWKVRRAATCLIYGRTWFYLSSRPALLLWEKIRKMVQGYWAWPLFQGYLKTLQPATFRISYLKWISVWLSESMEAKGHLSIPQWLVLSTYCTPECPSQSLLWISDECTKGDKTDEEIEKQHSCIRCQKFRQIDYRRKGQDSWHIHEVPLGRHSVRPLQVDSHFCCGHLKSKHTAFCSVLLLEEASWNYSWAPNSAWKTPLSIFSLDKSLFKAHSHYSFLFWSFP